MRGALQVKITSHLHKTSTAAEEEENVAVRRPTQNLPMTPS